MTELERNKPECLPASSTKLQPTIVVAIMHFKHFKQTHAVATNNNNSFKVSKRWQGWRFRHWIITSQVIYNAGPWF
jgi:hypothetical protein